MNVIHSMVICSSEPYLKLRQFLFSFGRLTVVSGGVGHQPAILLLFLFVGWMGAARKGEEVEVRRRERKKERKENCIVQVQPPWKRKGKHFVYSGPKP